MTSLRHPGRFAAGLLIAAAAATATGCGSGSSSGSGGGGKSGGAPDKIRIAYQAIPNGDLVVKNQRLLEKALPNTKIEWKLFDSGGTVNEAVAARSIDIGLVGSSPASRGLSTPLPYKVPWIHDVIGSAEALVARNGINSIADLKGKTVATPLASTSHYSLLAVLEEAGIRKDVKVVDAEPDDIAAAWSRGDIDAAYVWNPTLAKLEQDGGKVLTDSSKLAAEGKTTYDLGVVSDDFAKRYPDVVAKWAAAEDEAVTMLKDQPQKAAKAISAELNVPADQVLQQTKGLIYLDAGQQIGDEYLGGGLAKNLFSEAKFNQQLGQIPSVQPASAYEKGVDPQYAAQVAKH